MDPRLRQRAAGPGRIRGIALELWARAKERPAATGRIFADGLRDARALHSAERRLVQDALFALIRGERRLAHAIGTDDPEALWAAWLALDEDPPWRAAWDAAGEGLSPAERLALRHNWSPALAGRVAAQLGGEADAFAAASDERAPTDVRANARRCTAEALAERLRREGVETTRLEHGLRVVGRHNLVGLASYREGWFEVQDEGSQRIAALVEPAGLVIDVCAGAGGKSLAFAAAGADVLALDVRPAALAELERRAARAGVRIRTRRIDPDRLPDDLPRADRVVVDAPCTGTGVLRRHPEHRFVDDDAIAAQAAVQRRLLDQSAALLAPGARLVYATCSVLTDEGEDVTATMRPIREVRTWPHRDGCDGFYAAVV